MRYPWILLALATTTLWAQTDPSTDVPVTMTTDEQLRMAVSSMVLEARELPARFRAVIRAVDPTPLAQLDADLATASATAAASARELRRTEDLAAQDQSASQQALETARARAATDTATVNLLRRRLALEWGPYFASLSDADRGALIATVVSGRAALLRADVPERAEGVVGRVLIEVSAGPSLGAAQPLGLSGSADTRMQTVGLYCLVQGPEAAALRPGRTLAGWIESETTRTGVVLPRSAIVRLDGATWAYVRTGAETFARREVVDPEPSDEGWLVTQGFAPGVAVVDHGAGSLIAVERADETSETD